MVDIKTDERPSSESSDLRYDAFISYSRRDLLFAKRLEAALRAYRPPKDLAVPQRYLRVFRDESDFTGEEYRRSLERALNASAKLIVICSPNSASSAFVGEEIDLFSKCRGKEHIIPLLLDGIPNNEVTENDAGRRGFPEALVRLLPIPLAADYRGFNPARDKMGKGRFASAWFKTLADVYADYGVDREKIEQRERRRAAQRRRNVAIVSSVVAMVVIGLIVVALSSRQQAVTDRGNRDALRLAGQAQRQYEGADQSGDDLVKTVLLSVASVRSARTVDGHIMLAKSMGLLSRAPRWRQVLGAVIPQGATVSRAKALAFSADGTLIAATDGRGPVQLLDARSGKTVRSINVQRRPSQFTTLAFSPDGAHLIIGCGQQACVVDVARGQELARLSPADGRQSGTVWFAVFSPDGRLLATSSYGSKVISIYDTSSWKVSGSIVNPQGSSGVFSLAFSPSGEWLATGTPSGVQLWRVGKYDAPAAQVPAGGVIWSIAFRRDGESLVAAGNTLQAWDIESTDEGRGALLQKRALPDRKAQAVLPVVWHGAQCLATAGGTIRVWCGDDLAEMTRMPIESVGATVSADGLSLAAEQRDGTLALWSLDAGIEAARVSVGAPIVAMAMGEQSGWLAAGTDKRAADKDGGAVVVLELNTWRERARLPVSSSVAALGASPDGRWLAVAGGNVLRVFDTGNWREVKAATYDNPVTWAGFSAQGRSLIAVIGETVVALQPQDWSERAPAARSYVGREKQGDIRAVRVSPDERMLATTLHWPGGHDTGVEWTRVFDLQSGHEIGWKYDASGGSSFSQVMERRAADANRKLTGGDLKTVNESQSWSALELTGPRERESRDGAWSVDVSESWLELKDKAANRTIGTLRQHGDIAGAFFLPSAAPRWIVSGGKDGTVAVWPLRAEDLAEQACARLRALLDTSTLDRLATDAGAGQPCPAR